jgi:hypothetical protein
MSRSQSVRCLLGADIQRQTQTVFKLHTKRMSGRGYNGLLVSTVS